MKIIKKFFSNRKKIKKYKDRSAKLELENKELKSKIRDPNYADLMRDNLKSLNLVFDKAELPDYLEGLTPDERKAKIIEVNEIFKNQMFHKLVEYLINKQANFVLREATTDAHIYAGRFNINGMVLVKKEVERCHLLFEDMNTVEEFDPLEILQK